VLGIFWRRATRQGAVAGMLTGLGLTLYYLVGVKFMGMEKWWGIGDVSAGVFGIPAGFLVIVVVSLFTSMPDRTTRDLVEQIRYPALSGARQGPAHSFGPGWMSAPVASIAGRPTGHERLECRGFSRNPPP
jgi:Na+/proline symporter